MFLLKQFKPHEIQLANYFRAFSFNPPVKPTRLWRPAYLYR